MSDLHGLGQRRSILAVFFACAAALSACDGGSTGPSDQPATIAAAGGDQQVAAVGQLLGQALSVIVLDEGGGPLSGIQVQWAVTGGGGDVDPAQSATGADGVATTQWTLGSTLGPQSATAVIEGLPPVTFQATAEPGPPDRIVITPADPTIDALGGTVTLEAELQDEFGNATGGGSFEWSSGDEGVATVEAGTGVATGVAVGTADITAEDAGAGLSETVTLEVRQVAASIEVTPPDPAVAVGAMLQLTARVTDANDHEIPEAAVDWSSGNEAIATVDGNGLVTGEAEGDATITAASGDVSTDVVVSVILVPDDFAPMVDQDIGGVLTVGNVVVPAGVTITVTDDTEIHAFGDVTIDGTLTGDCVRLDVIGTGALDLTGLIENDCSAPGAGDAPDLLVQVQGAMNVVGAELGSSGSVTLTNVVEAAALARAAGDGPSLRAELGRQGVAEGTDCSFADLLIRSTDQPDGAAGSPTGANGGTGEPQILACAGTARFEGPGNTGIFGHDGGRGGGGESSTSGVVARGGDGGSGADAIVMAGGDVVVATVVVIIQGGEGGDGGTGSAMSYPTAEAVGGSGGPPGLGRVVAGGEIRTEGTGKIELEVGTPGRGGGAVANGLDGNAATSQSAATPGGDAIAQGGDGASWGGPEGAVVLSDMIQGTLAPGANVEPGVFLIFPPHAGSAIAVGGRGGDGSFEFPDGARGGNQTAVGGKGGDVNIFDNRGAQLPLNGAEPGDGGNIFFQGSRGGDGASRCMVFPVRSGGIGGDGGDLVGNTGEGGADGSGGQADPGDATYVEVSNGGAGGDGNPPGTGGAGGDDALVVVGGSLSVQDPSRQPGPGGDPCVTGFDVTIAVQSDPNGHEPFIMMTSVTMLDVAIDENGNISITSSSAIWIPVSGTIQGDGSFEATGTGTAASFPNVPVSFEGTVETDAEGNITGIGGTLTVDSTNSVLPPDGDGVRNPAVYTVSGTKKGG